MIQLGQGLMRQSQAAYNEQAALSTEAQDSSACVVPSVEQPLMGKTVTSSKQPYILDAWPSKGP